MVSRLRENGDFSKSIRKIAHLSGCSVGSVAKTMAWTGYVKKKRECASHHRMAKQNDTRRRRHAESVEGRVFQIVKEATSKGDFSLTVRMIAQMIRRSSAAVGKSKAWEVYVRAREAEKDSTRSRLKGHRIK